MVVGRSCACGEYTWTSEPTCSSPADGRAERRVPDHQLAPAQSPAATCRLTATAQVRLPASPARTVFLLAASTVPASSQLPDMLTELRLGFLKNFTRKMSELGRWLYQIWCPHVYLAAHVESHSHVIQAAMSRDADCAMYKHLHCFYRKNPALTLTTVQSCSGFSVTASISIISIVYLNRCCC